MTTSDFKKVQLTYFHLFDSIDNLFFIPLVKFSMRSRQSTEYFGTALRENAFVHSLPFFLIVVIVVKSLMWFAFLCRL